MSVINQMLKDLDQRQAEQQGTSNFAPAVAPESSNKKIIIIILLVFVLLNAAGIFVWKMYTENQALKSSQTSVLEQAEKNAIKNKAVLNSSSQQNPQNSNLLIVANADNGEILNNQQNGIIDNTLETKTLDPADIKPADIGPDELEPESLRVEVFDENELKEIPPESSVAANNINKTQIDSATSPLKAFDEKTNQLSAPKALEVKKSTLKISRKQLTPSELAKQKLKRAEQALDVNDVAKAESLFEEILLVVPEHKSARKQLAALWFGRQSYNDALNLLSQGIVLAPEDSELRIMKARIYLQQNQLQQAFEVLNNMPRANEVVNVEYQSLRATTAQQLNEYKYAVQAYQILVNLEPSAGRWWLGLAVALDSNSEFKEAIIAYQAAINQTGLSGSAETFARQRIIELGE